MTGKGVIKGGTGNRVGILDEDNIDGRRPGRCDDDKEEKQDKTKKKETLG